MSLTDCVKLTILLGLAAFVLLPASQASGQEGPQPWKVIPSGDTGNPADDVTDMVVNENGIVALPNPYPVMITDWQILPPGRSWGAGPAGGFGPDGHYWQMDRCGSDSYLGCLENPVNYVLKFDVDTGQLLQSFGAGEVFSPHAIRLDTEGNIWVTDQDASPDSTMGLQVLKYNPQGQIVMRLGTAGKVGTGPNHFENPIVTVIAPNGDIFISEGHDADGTIGRIKKYSPTGQFIKEIDNGNGNGIGQFKNPHSMAFDSQGRLFVADRYNHRIQIFDQDLNYLESYYAYGMCSAIAIQGETLYCSDSSSSWTEHPGWLPGTRIGLVNEDTVTGFIPPHGHPTRPLGVSGGGISVAPNGSIYVQEGPGARDGLRGTGMGEGGTLLYHKTDVSYPRLQGRVYRDRDND